MWTIINKDNKNKEKLTACFNCKSILLVRRLDFQFRSFGKAEICYLVCQECKAERTFGRVDVNTVWNSIDKIEYSFLGEV